MSRKIIDRFVCEQCGSRFDRNKSGGRPIRFCTIGCYHAWRKASGVTTGQFSAGRAPWNKDVKGIHLSPATEYKKGRKPENYLPVGSITVRTDKQGRDRAWVKTSEPNHWRERAAINWEAFYGRPVPDGKVIHHKDRDTLNDAPANLKALTRAEHIEEHRRELLAAKSVKAKAA